MKKLILFLSIALFFFSSCEETIIPLPDLSSGTERNVLIEEYSGGECAPCAGAHDELQNLLSIYGENLIVVTMHTYIGGASGPVHGSTYDFRTDEGQEIVDHLGQPFGLPSGVINRKAFAGGSPLQLVRSKWAGVVADEVNIAPKAGLNIETHFEPGSRELSIDVTIVPAEQISGDARLTVMITESSIVDKQLTLDGVVDEYVHNHILRDVISQTLGDPLGASLPTGIAVEKRYQYTLPQADGGGPWVPENCNVIAFLSLVDEAAGTKEVLQADEAHVVE